MAEGGVESEDYLKYIAEDSGNVAADGNFSVQVCVVLQQNQRYVGQHIFCWVCCAVPRLQDNLVYLKACSRC